jgi:hypothetical protein
LVVRGKNEVWVDEVPTLEGFLVVEDVTMGEFSERCRGDEELRRVVEICRMASKDKLLRGGLMGDYNAPVVGMVMDNEHGYSKKVDVRSEVVEMDPEERVKRLEFLLEDARRRGEVELVPIEVIESELTTNGG